MKLISALMPYLELLQFCLGDGVGLRDDGNDVHFRVQLLHANQVDGLEPVTWK